VSRGEIRVFVHHRAADRMAEPIHAAYLLAASDLAGTPGYLGDELLCPRADSGRRTLLMRWDDITSYAAWERAHRERGHPSPLRAYQDRALPGGHHQTFIVVAAIRGDEQQTTATD
jgi:heme-degrading monooxygenase HmoA